MSWTGLRDAAVALAPATVVRLLADVTGAAGGDPPSLVLYLTGGHVIEGDLVRTGADRGSDVVVLTDRATSRLGYALLANVVAVEVRNPAPFQDVLTAGRQPVPSAGGPVTRLRLQREFAPDGNFPVRVDWAALDGTDVVLANLASLLRGLRDAVALVRADEMGQRAWEQIRDLRVEHHAGSELTVLSIPDGLSVSADLSAALPRALTGELNRRISALL